MTDDRESLIEDYKLAFGAFIHYESLIYSSANALYVFAIPLGGITLGAGNLAEPIQIFASVSGVLLSTLWLVSSERLRRAANNRWAHAEKIGLTLGLDFVQNDRQFIRSGDPFMLYTHSSMFLRIFVNILFLLFFISTTIALLWFPHVVS